MIDQSTCLSIRPSHQKPDPLEGGWLVFILGKNVLSREKIIHHTLVSRGRQGKAGREAADKLQNGLVGCWCRLWDVTLPSAK